MKPFLALFAGNPREFYPEPQAFLEKETPVDFLFIDATSTDSYTYRYSSSTNLLKELQEIINDYPLLLLFGAQVEATFQSSCKPITEDSDVSLWFIDPILKKVRCENEDFLELQRYFFIKGYEINIQGTVQKFKGLTLAEFEMITQTISLNERDLLDELLRREALLSFNEKPSTLDAYAFIQRESNAQTEGNITTANKPTEISSGKPVFLLLKPNLHLWVYTKAFATAGSLDYDLQKLLKETKHRKEEVRYCTFTQESCINDHIFMFMDNFESDNELELAFKLDTIRQEVEDVAKSKGFNILGERTSKTSRIFLLEVGNSETKKTYLV